MAEAKNTKDTTTPIPSPATVEKKFPPTAGDVLITRDELAMAKENEHSSSDLTMDPALQEELEDMDVVEKLESAMEKDPGIIGRLRAALGIASPLPVANEPPPRTTAEIASSYPINSVEMSNMTMEKAAKLTGADEKEVLSYSVRGNVADDNGVITDPNMFVTVVKNDGTKVAKQVSGEPVRG